MKHSITYPVLLLVASALVALGCSSDGDSTSVPPAFTSSGQPSWALDLQSNDEAPVWDEPSSTDFECSMHIIVDLSPELLPYSTDNDIMAIFISDQCRGISYRNTYDDGTAVYLLHAKGTSDEVNVPMQIRYYCSSLRQIFVEDRIPGFTPNNILEQSESYQLRFTPYGSSSKYPKCTEISVVFDGTLPFSVTDSDKLAVFVGNECRGLISHVDQSDTQWVGSVLLRQSEESGQIRYYSSQKGGVYTFSNPITLTEGITPEISLTF